MSDLVPTDKIEQIVGARRHPLAHLGRTDSTSDTVFILHSQACKDSGIDLRYCVYSKALDNGIDTVSWRDWEDHEDETVTLQVAHGWLLPDLDGPDDIEYLSELPASTDGGAS